jgi:hypothetical protein
MNGDSGKVKKGVDVDLRGGIHSSLQDHLIRGELSAVKACCTPGDGAQNTLVLGVGTLSLHHCCPHPSPLFRFDKE